MDPLTQGLLGGVAAQATLQNFPEQEKGLGRRLYWAGVFGGMAPDLDILIRSSDNPLLGLQFHRHFTHSLSFIPIGGLIVALVFWLLWRKKILSYFPDPHFRGHRPFLMLFWAATIGYATHGLLDACTSYGTMLYWPWASTRVAWNTISIMDPLFTGLLFIGFLWGIFSVKHFGPRVLLMLAFCYMGFGFWQNHQGRAIQQALANTRSQTLERGRVHPSFGNLFVWRSIYESEGRLYVDSLRLIPGKSAEYWQGGSLAKFDYKKLNSPIPEGSVMQKDIELYTWFSDDYLALIPDTVHEAGDMRFGLQSDSLYPLWGFAWDPQKPDSHIRPKNYRDNFNKAIGPAWEQLKARIFEGGGRKLKSFP